ncbi:DUF3667 domain-containing protein [Rufibacter glacialis]|uniref:DUF3667 domain-containing protein n=1 Tax=Rufibacter glacialis TaxID=1259555 RepID=A0A5M8Q544_9BACT|nr:DUF3667 domain-containing protein [Rufibacter glacialis]KAA6430959.1 DUF3667 domain-containing protein [Rufibacter glacialis]GGK82879.1 hypothetical protein GCM10011405_33330 [Rufibacter glacialis]
MGKHLRKYPVCTNCDYTFTKEQPDNFCPRCGQENHDLNVPFKHVALEVLEGTIHYDTKFWTTIKYLLFYPGKLTNEFHRGRRIGYVPPIRLYVFINFVFFFLLSMRVGHVENEQQNRSIAEQVKSKNAAEFLNQVEVANDSVTAVVGQKQLADSLVKVGRSEMVKQSKTLESTLEKMGSVSDFAPQATIDSLIRDADLSPNWYTQSAMRKGVHLIKLPQEQLITKLLKYWSVLMFVLMPIFALLLKLVFFKARRFYIEHLMFSIHLHCFVFLLFIIYMLSLYLFTSFDLFAWVNLLGALYLYLGLKRVFRRSRLRTLFNMAAVLFLYFFAGIITLGLGLLVSAVL